MPNVNGKKYPYTKAGMAAAKKAAEEKKAAKKPMMKRRGKR
jgi:hypothetical protein